MIYSYINKINQMSYLETYKLLERMSKAFKLDLDDNTTDLQRTASTSVANNIQSEQNDSLCANMISEVVKVAAERVKGKQQSRTASVTTSSTSKIDEVALLKSFMKAYQ